MGKSSLWRKLKTSEVNEGPGGRGGGRKNRASSRTERGKIDLSGGLQELKLLKSGGGKTEMALVLSAEGVSNLVALDR